MARWIIATLVLMMGLAGCAEEEPGDAGAPDEPEAPSGQDDSENPSTEEPVGDAGKMNHLPEIDLQADVVNGTQPLQVDFTLDASDADDDDLTWSFDADGDGEVDMEGDALPASFNHTYDEGIYTATARVSDGEEDVASSVEITVDEETVVALQEIWALRWATCDEGRIMSLTQPSDFGCAYTFQLANLVVSEDGALEHDFQADGPTGGFPVGTPVRMELEAGIIGPYAGSLSARLLADGEVVGNASVQDVGPDVSPVEKRQFSAEFAVNQEIAEGAMLTFVFHMETAGYMEMTSGSLTIG